MRGIRQEKRVDLNDAGNPGRFLKRSWLFGAGKVFALLVPVFSGFSMIYYAKMWICSTPAKPEGIFLTESFLSGPLPLFYLAIMVSITLFLAVCVCSVNKIPLLQYSKFMAFTFFWLYFMAAIFMFVFEIVFDIYTGWFGDCLIGTLCLGFYYLMIKYKINMML